MILVLQLINNNMKTDYASIAEDVYVDLIATLGILIQESEEDETLDEYVRGLKDALKIVQDLRRDLV